MIATYWRSCGPYRLTVRPALRTVTVAGRGRVDCVPFEGIAAQIRFYRFLSEASQIPGWSAPDLAAWQVAAEEVAWLEQQEKKIAPMPRAIGHKLEDAS